MKSSAMIQWPKKSAEYSDLQPMNIKMDFAYGPIQSRRLGLSLGVNPFGEERKICSYDCPYCELGPTQIKMSQLKKEITFASAETVDNAVREKLVALQKTDKPLPNTLCLSGYGEPTLYPHLIELIDALVKTREELAPSLRLSILTNGAHIDNKRLAQALLRLDDRIVKVDAGNEATLKKINAPIVKANMSKIIHACRQMEPVIVQSLFVQGAVDNTKPSDIEEWIEVVGIIKPLKVQICNLNRIPATSGLKKLDEDSLYIISSKLKKRTHIESQVFV